MCEHIITIAKEHSLVYINENYVILVKHTLIKQGTVQIQFPIVYIPCIDSIGTHLVFHHIGVQEASFQYPVVAPYTYHVHLELGVGLHKINWSH